MNIHVLVILGAFAVSCRSRGHGEMGSLHSATPSPRLDLLTDIEPISKAPPRNFSEDRKGSGPQKTPGLYGEKRIPRPVYFAGATVLEGMRRIRQYWWLQSVRLPNGETVSIPDSKAVTITEARSMSQVNPDKPIDKIHDSRDSWNEDTQGNPGGNMGAIPSNYSDIQGHFLPNIPTQQHGCWTSVLRDSFRKGCDDPFVAGEKIPPQQWRETALLVCSGAISVRDDAGCHWHQAINLIPSHLAAYNLLWVDKNDGTFIEPDYATLTDSGVDPSGNPRTNDKINGIVFAANQRKEKHFNVWDYVMVSQTYAFDFEQQQAVLNAFYGDLKRFKDPNAPPFDPVTDCNNYRPRLPADPIDGTHCLSTKVMLSTIAGNGG